MPTDLAWVASCIEELKNGHPELNSKTIEAISALFEGEACLKALRPSECALIATRLILNMAPPLDEQEPAQGQ